MQIALQGIRILIVEDRAVLAHDLVDRLEDYGCDAIVGPAASGEEALALVKQSAVDIAILDIKLKGEMDGIRLAHLLNENEAIPVIYLTNQEDERLLEAALQTFPVAFLNKPFTNMELKSALFNAVRKLDEGQSNGFIGSVAQDVLTDRIFVKRHSERYAILLDDILWIRSYQGDTSVIMTAADTGKPLNELPLLGLSLGAVLDKLSFYPSLVRASRYFIVNTKHVTKVVDLEAKNKHVVKKAVVIDTEQIELSDRFRKQVTDRFLNL